MAKNKLIDLKNHLFAQLERLNDETITEEEMKAEIEKAKAMEGISKQIIESEKIQIDAAHLCFKFLEAGYKENQIPLISNSNITDKT